MRSRVCIYLYEAFSLLTLHFKVTPIIVSFPSMINKVFHMHHTRRMYDAHLKKAASLSKVTFFL